MSTQEAMVLMLRALKLPGFLAHFEELARKAEKSGWSFGQYLHHLSELELEERRIRKVRKRVCAAEASDPVLAGVSLDQLVAAAERLDVRGLHQASDWANKPKLDRIPELNEAVARTDAGKKNLETIEEIGRQRRKTAAGARLTLNPKLIRREQKR